MGMARDKILQDKNGTVCVGRGRKVIGLPNEI